MAAMTTDAQQTAEAQAQVEQAVQEERQRNEVLTRLQAITDEITAADQVASDLRKQRTKIMVEGDDLRIPKEHMARASGISGPRVDSILKAQRAEQQQGAVERQPKFASES